MRHVQTHTFNGPLDLLLQLIEQEEMDISKVSLAKVTEEYIRELQKLDELPMDELAEFLVVAAKLLVIKSRLMIPGQEVEEDAGFDLERQLKMYQAFVQASRQLAKRFNRHKVSYARDGWAVMDPIFNPPPEVKPADLESIFRQVLHQLEPIIRLPQTVMVRTINIRQKIEQVRDLLLQQPSTSFHTLLNLAVSKTEVIVTFLAVLELVKQRTVTVSQGGAYADMDIIMIEQPV